MTGVNTSIPAVSPVHHVIHALREPPGGTTPAVHRAATPIVLARVHEPAIVVTDKNTRRARLKKLPSPANRRSNQNAISCSSVLPTPIANAASTPCGADASVGKFAKKAARVMLGERRPPNSNRAANATPAGGQKAEAFAPGNCSTNP